MKLGARPYTDREYVITELPESLFGLTFLQTCNGHKGRRGPDFQVTLSLPEGAGVFLAVDERVFARFEATGEVPAWLKEYRVTEYRIAIDDPAADYEYRVLFKELGPGQTTLGEPGGFSSDSMYFVFFSDLETAKELAVQSEELPFGPNRPTQNGPPRRLVSEY